MQLKRPLCQIAVKETDMVEIAEKEYQRLQARLQEMEVVVAKRKQEAEEARRMATVVRDSNDAITIQDFEGNISAWNHGAEVMFGYSEKEALRLCGLAGTLGSELPPRVP